MATMPNLLCALVVDDAAPALSALAGLLGQDARIGQVHTAGSSAQALQALRSEPVDVLVCDTSMPDRDRRELARALAEVGRRPHLIFVTAGDRPAVATVDRPGVAYVVKPVRAERLAEAVRRIAEARSTRHPVPEARNPHDEPAPDETITVELAGVTRLVQRSAVLFVQAQGDYARLHTATGSHLIRVPMGTLEQRWAAAGFIRIHRSTLVALAHVDEVRMDGGRFCIRLGNRTLQVSRRHSRQLRELLARRAVRGYPTR